MPDPVGLTTAFEVNVVLGKGPRAQADAFFFMLRVFLYEENNLIICDLNRRFFYFHIFIPVCLFSSILPLLSKSDGSRGDGESTTACRLRDPRLRL